MPPFVHLHLHTEYSLLDGANRPEEVCRTAAEMGMPAIALTDHGNLFGAINFHDAARQAGIKPIIGIEAYVADGSHTERNPARKSSNHLVLLARDETGYRNLIKLTTISFLDGHYYKPRIDHELLRRHADGLIGLSACLKGEVSERILAGDLDGAEATAKTYREILGEENYFLEMQDHGIPEQRQVNAALRDLSRRTGIPLVLSNDCHYLRQDDATAHDVLLCIGTGRTLADPDRIRYATDQFYLKSGEEMATLFPRDSEALENTLRIAERCDLKIAREKYHLPEFTVPPGHTRESYLEKIVEQGLGERLAEQRRRQGPGAPKVDEAIYWERLRLEMEVIRRVGFAGYFLVVWDFIRFAREQRIPVGPGRGSAAGSLVSWALRITDIDPLRYGLLFERFLNADRISMPDIDIDFCMRRRGEVIQYVSEKYGRDHVAQIITFGTLQAKAVIRDVGRVLGIPYDKTDRIAKLLPENTRSLKEAATSVESLTEEIRKDPEVRQIVELGSRLEGLSRHPGMHAAGVVIAPCPIDELVPLCRTANDEILTQWDMTVIEKLGLLKMDFLGLRTLTVIDDTLTSLRRQGIELDLDIVPLDDPEVYRLFCEGRTSGIFQFESVGMREMLRNALPSRFEDLAALNALYRPGALGAGVVRNFVARKHGREKVTYILPETREILEETYGIIAYQEQVMQLAVRVAGFTASEADVLRKAMGKKKPEVMAEQRAKFVDGAAQRGVQRKRAEMLWEYIEPFAGYGFNKSHAVAYALIAYKTAYLKAHHPVAFMAAMLSSEMGTTDDVIKHIVECGEMGIEVLPPDVNESEWPFTIDGERIRFGLGAIKGLGEGAAEAILEARQRLGSFQSLGELVAKVEGRHFNQKVLDCLIHSGALDCFGFHRAALAAAAERMLDYAQRRRQERAVGQNSLFDDSAAIREPKVDPQVPTWEEPERLRREKEALGFYLTGNPLQPHAPALRRLATHTVAELREPREGRVTVGGLVTRLRRAKIRSGPSAGRMMGHFVLEDLTGVLPVTLFADQLQRFESLLVEDAIVLVTGSLRERGASWELTVDEVMPLERAAQRLIRAFEVRLGTGLPATDLLRLRDLFAENPGETPVELRFDLPAGPVVVVLGAGYRVASSPMLVAAAERVVGAGRVREAGRNGDS
ncbi:MAG TPA: DNA polymerase III subunit alpha [Thermoanaerobaculia bacterium]|jgi:DNA polymerase-3 subunit alpha|nr:MAG: DNA polymerase III subunit alpha [Acidobacteria bacterium ADurb.Bin051]HQN39191.1 DNA polymerase III subunit alpha [Thermoanaerobaculia bacterium]